MAAILKRSLIAVVCVGLAACLLSACETQPLQKATQGLALEGPLAPAPSRTWADAAQDVNDYRIGGWGLVAMPAMQAYLNGLYRQLKNQGGHPEWPGEVYVLADTSLKSNATPAGNIYLSLGWLQSIESEDEIFALLAHEFGHIYLGHHVVYDVSNAGDAASRLAALGIALADKTSNAAGLNGVYAIAALRSVAGSTLVPAWKRSIEEEADRFGATLSLRANYNYPSGFKTVLERISSYDAIQREQANRASTAAERLQREASLSAVAERARQSQGNPKDVTGLQAGVSNLEVKLNAAMFDAGAAIKRALASAAARAQETHDDADTREEQLTKAVVPALAGRPRPATRTAPWEAIKNEAGTAEIMAHYALLPKVEESLSRNAYAEALKTATVAASGRTANDAWPLSLLRTAILLAKPGTSVAALDKRQFSAAERSWQYAAIAIKETAQSNRESARVLWEQQFNYFQKAPALWPEVIGLYRRSGYLNEARAMANTCALTLANYREACIVNAQTDEEKRAIAAASEQKAKELADQLAGKLKLK